MTLHDIDVSLAVNAPVAAVREIPSGQPIAFSPHDGRVDFPLAGMTGHAMIEVAYTRL